MDGKVDLRIKKTHATLLRALRELLCEKSFNEISVAELCERAEVRRATFYKHFGDKGELLAYMIQQLQKGYGDRMDKSTVELDDGAYLTEVLKNFLDFMDENRQMARTVLNSSARQIVLDILNEQIERDLRLHFRALQQRGAALRATPDMLAVLCSGAAVNCAQWWIANSDRLTKEEIVRQFEALVTSI